MTDTAEVLFSVEGRAGVITLNRPQALNALTFEMVRDMDRQLVSWAGDRSIEAVMITGTGDRAFCSGGDIKSVALEALAVRKGESDGALARDFFRAEYTLNHRIFTFPKPYVALIDGIVMGGGKGVSAHGSHRVVTEKTLFAMPETGIGFFPDVGGGYFLPRCPGQTGAYLALTSKRIGAADTLYIGFGTHFVPSEKMAALRADIAKNSQDINSILKEYTALPPAKPELAEHREKIDRCFSHDHVEEIMAALEKDPSLWAQETLRAMRGLSPGSLKIALRQIRQGGGMNFAEVMTMEYRLSQACVRRPDFYEGVRAALIDKDRQPKWQPSAVADVPDVEIEACFRSLGANDLVL